MPGTRHERELFDYIVLKTPLHQNISGGSTSKLVLREPQWPNNWRLELQMMKEITIWAKDKDDKYCPHCGRDRAKKEFNKDTSRKDGLDGWCRTCRESERLRRKWLAEDSEQLMQVWQHRHIERVSALLFDKFKDDEAA